MQFSRCFAKSGFVDFLKELIAIFTAGGIYHVGHFMWGTSCGSKEGILKLSKLPSKHEILFERLAYLLPPIAYKLLTVERGECKWWWS